MALNYNLKKEMITILGYRAKYENIRSDVISSSCSYAIYILASLLTLEILLLTMAALYRSMISSLDKFIPPSFQPMWHHPAGPKTIFFWAPIMKWSLVIAGIGDLNRPAEKLSAAQSTALAATGLIWSRYSLVITPKNWSLFSVNLLVAATGVYQLLRVFRYKASIREKNKVFI